VHAIRVVARGDSVLAPTVTRRLLESYVPRSPSPHDKLLLTRLTEREQEVLRLVAQGRSNAEIGNELFLSEATVKTHVGRVLHKLDCRDRVQAAVFAIRSGFA
jgi:DNA-binding NarL/FixJ family response regulator